MESSRISSSEGAQGVRPGNPTARSKKGGDADAAPNTFTSMLAGATSGSELPSSAPTLSVIRKVGKPAESAEANVDLTGQQLLGGQGRVSALRDGLEQDDGLPGFAASDGVPEAGGLLASQGPAGAGTPLRRIGSGPRVDADASASMGSDAARLLVSTLWAGHSGALGGEVAQTSRMDSATETPTDTASAGGVLQRTKLDKHGAVMPAGLPAMKQWQQQGKTLSTLQTRTESATTLGAQASAALLAADGTLSEQAARRGSEGGANHGGILAAGMEPVGSIPLSSLAGLADMLGRSSGQSRASSDGQKNAAGLAETKAVFEVGTDIGQDMPGAVSDASASALEDAVSEQVSYWLTENLKNAQLTVEHAGQPVHVQISLDGKQAHVAFRSDQLQTRELLDAHMHELRDLLQGEGLVLSGVSVDSQGAGKSGSGEPDRAAVGLRQTRVAVDADRASARSDGAIRNVPRGALDLFV